MVKTVYSFTQTEGSLHYSVGGVCDSGMLISLPSVFLPSDGIFFTFTAAGESAFRFVAEMREKIAGMLITINSGYLSPRLCRRFVPPVRRLTVRVKRLITGVLGKCRILRL